MAKRNLEIDIDEDKRLIRQHFRQKANALFDKHRAEGRELAIRQQAERDELDERYRETLAKMGGEER